MSTGAILAITDGTKRVDLLDPGIGIILRSWSPARPQRKESVTGSPLATGESIKQYNWADVVDTFVFDIRANTPDLLIYTGQLLDELLQEAIDYQASNFMTTPVWIEARGAYETNLRYAIVKSYTPWEDACPYYQPFTTSNLAAMPAVTLVVKHAIWQSARPGQFYGDLTPISAEQVYGALTYGRDDTITGLPALSPGEWYMGNKANMANLTHAYFLDVSTGVWTGNLITDPLPHALFPNPIENGDYLMIGCQLVAGASGGPFCNVIWDLLASAVIVGAAHFDFEYYGPAGWLPLTVYDNTSNFTRISPDDVCGLHWRQPANWNAVAFFWAITAYWIRIVASIGPGESITTPTEHNRRMYTCTWPRIDIDEEDIGGDLPALAQLRISGRSDLNAAPAIEGYANRILLGLRSQWRGADFCPYINFAGGGGWSQNAAGITVGLAGAGSCAWQNDVTTPTGYSVAYTPGAGPVAMQDEMYVQFGTVTIARQYRGNFHIYLRYNVPAGANGDLRMRLCISTGVNTTSFYYTDSVPLLVSTRWTVADFGEFTLPPRGADIYNETRILIMVQLEELTAAARTATLYDLVLMPCDEWFADIQENTTPATVATYPLAWAHFLVLDSIHNTKDAPMTAVPMNGESSTYGPYPEGSLVPAVVGPMILQAKKDQRMWIFMQHCLIGASLPHYAPPHLAVSVILYKAQRYQSMRGAQ